MRTSTSFRPGHASTRLMTDAEVLRARQLRLAGWTLARLSRRFEISEGALSRIFRGLTYNGVGFIPTPAKPAPPPLAPKVYRYRQTEAGRARVQLHQCRYNLRVVRRPETRVRLMARIADLESYLESIGRPVRNPTPWPRDLPRKDAS